MYEELQQKRKPKIPKSIKADGIRGMLGILSPSKLQVRRCASNKTEEEVRYFIEEGKYRLYKRMICREEWRAIYRRYRIDQHKTDASKRVRSKEDD